jgi:hypothetical protein
MSEPRSSSRPAAPRPASAADLRRDLRRQGIDTESVSGRWLLRILMRGERTGDNNNTDMEDSK